MTNERAALDHRDSSGALPLDIAEAASGLRAGRWSSEELTARYLARADVLDAELGVYLSRLDEQAIEAAVVADRELAAGLDRGALHGVPLGIKDNIAVHGASSTAQSRVGYADRDAPDGTAVSRLRDAGAILVGKTTLMEYAIGAPDPSKGFPLPRNPFDIEHWAGGSSSGTASGIAASLFLGGLGTDTGGSLRMPAAWCGVTGLKPTFGRVPKDGTAPLGYSFDVVGPMGRTALDCAVILEAIAGPAPADPSSRPPGAPATELSQVPGRLENVRIGYDPGLLQRPDCDPDVVRLMLRAYEVLEDAGASLIELALPMYGTLKAATVMGFCAEAFNYHRPRLRDSWLDYGLPARLAIAAGAFVTASEYIQIQRIRRVGTAEVNRLFAQVDIVATPTCLAPAPRVDELDFDNIVEVITTQYWSAVGYPAISVPMGRTGSGLPLGLQLAARPWDEAGLLNAAVAFQDRSAHHRERPVLSGGRG